MTNKGEPYGPYRFKQIVKECYLISKTINTSYNEVLDITPIERAEILKLIVDEIEQKKEEFKKIEEQADALKKKR